VPWARFTASYDFKPRASVTLAYQAGWSGLVSVRCLAAAVAAGKAENHAPPEGGADAGRTDAPTAGVGEA